jgi:hypothetical protein
MAERCPGISISGTTSIPPVFGVKKDLLNVFFGIGEGIGAFDPILFARSPAFQGPFAGSKKA